jgi:hypothetical protein
MSGGCGWVSAGGQCPPYNSCPPCKKLEHPRPEGSRVACSVRSGPGGPFRDLPPRSCHPPIRTGMLLCLHHNASQFRALRQAGSLSHGSLRFGAFIRRSLCHCQNLHFFQRPRRRQRSPRRIGFRTVGHRNLAEARPTSFWGPVRGVIRPRNSGAAEGPHPSSRAFDHSTTHPQMRSASHCGSDHNDPIPLAGVRSVGTNHTWQPGHPLANRVVSGRTRPSTGRSSSGALRKDSNTTRHGPRRRRHPKRVHQFETNSTADPTRLGVDQLAGSDQADALRGEGAFETWTQPAGSDRPRSRPGESAPWPSRARHRNRFLPDLAMR